MSLNEECVYITIINLDNRPDRYEKTISLINNSAMKNCWLQRFSAINGYNLIHDLTEKQLIEDPILPILKNMRQEIACGELGCFLSHYFLLKKIAEDMTLNNDDLILIMEDDIKLASNFNDRFSNVIREIRNQNENVNIIYMGGRFHENFEPKNYEFFDKWSGNIYLRNLQRLLQSYPNQSFDDLLEPRCENYDRTTHSYIIRKRVAQSMSQYMVQFLLSTQNFLSLDTYIYGMMKPTFDVFPHLFYSPLHYGESDIQNTVERFNTTKL
jgi:GR25 family glycosyltransferase involved in LPS biosynthesis